MNSKRVAILLSTYNGEQYVAEQLQSILNQSYEYITVYIRDDFSTDGTVEIIQSFNDKRIHFIEGDRNLGYPGGFYELLSMDIKADYFSFSDQDDVWHPDKIKRAVKMLENSSNDIPVMYFAAYDMCDENLNKIKTLPAINFEPQFRNSLFQCLALGYTMVVNAKAKELSLKKKSKKIVSKDVWIAMICSGVGTIIYDERSCASYRRNEGAYSVSDTSFIKIQMHRFSTLFLKDGFSKIKILMTEFYDVFGHELDPAKRKELELFCNTKYSVIRSIKKTIYPHRLRYSMSDELLLRFMFLIGKV